MCKLNKEKKIFKPTTIIIKTSPTNDYLRIKQNELDFIKFVSILQLSNVKDVIKIIKKKIKKIQEKKLVFQLKLYNNINQLNCYLFIFFFKQLVWFRNLFSFIYIFFIRIFNDFLSLLYVHICVCMLVWNNVYPPPAKRFVSLFFLFFFFC